MWQQQRLGYLQRQYDPGVLRELRGLPVPSSAGTILQLGVHRCDVNTAACLWQAPSCS